MEYESALIRHAQESAGYSASKVMRIAPNRYWMFLLVTVAVLPDVDYILYWVFDLEFPIRYTHSIDFCLLAPFLAGIILKSAGSVNPHVRILQIMAASFSHLALDTMVGVLPSAGRLDFSNRYLYVNLIIEGCRF